MHTKYAIQGAILEEEHDLETGGKTPVFRDWRNSIACDFDWGIWRGRPLVSLNQGRLGFFWGSLSELWELARVAIGSTAWWTESMWPYAVRPWKRTLNRPKPTGIAWRCSTGTPSVHFLQPVKPEYVVVKTRQVLGAGQNQKRSQRWPGSRNISFWLKVEEVLLVF